MKIFEPLLPAKGQIIKVDEANHQITVTAQHAGNVWELENHTTGNTELWDGEDLKQCFENNK